MQDNQKNIDNKIQTILDNRKSEDHLKGDKKNQEMLIYDDSIIVDVNNYKPFNSNLNHTINFRNSQNETSNKLPKMDDIFNNNSSLINNCNPFSTVKSNIFDQSSGFQQINSKEHINSFDSITDELLESMPKITNTDFKNYSYNGDQTKMKNDQTSNLNMEFTKNVYEQGMQKKSASLDDILGLSNIGSNQSLNPKYYTNFLPDEIKDSIESKRVSVYSYNPAFQQNLDYERKINNYDISQKESRNNDEILNYDRQKAFQTMNQQNNMMNMPNQPYETHFKPYRRSFELSSEPMQSAYCNDMNNANFRGSRYLNPDMKSLYYNGIIQSRNYPCSPESILFRNPINPTEQYKSQVYYKIKKRRRLNSNTWNVSENTTLLHPSKLSSLEFLHGQNNNIGNVSDTSNSSISFILNSNGEISQENMKMINEFKNIASSLDFNNVTVFQLKQFMRDFGLNHSGKKNDLINRIKNSIYEINMMLKKQANPNIKETPEKKEQKDETAYDKFFF